MQSAIFHAQTQHTRASTINHQQIQCKILNKEVGIMFQALSIQCMQHSMAGSIFCTGSSVGLATFSEFEGLAAESTLVDFTF
jgi:hypothetical protein